MVAVLGLMLGSAFTPDIMARVGHWLPSMAALLLYIAAVTAVLFLYFYKVAGYDRVTAYFSASPGGLNEMVFVGGEMGGDVRTISLIHGGRVLFVVLVVPFGFALFGGYEAGARPPLGAAWSDIPLADFVVLAGCGFVGFVAARALRIPAAAVVGPMFLSAAVHALGVTAARPPGELVACAQIVVGAAAGSRFAGIALRRVLRTLVTAFGASIVMIGFTAAFALALAPIAEASFPALVLAFAPGGLAEMSLIALALGVDAAFVSSHHIIRIIIVVILAPAAFRRAGWQNPERSRERGAD
jgi:membrane AbrB-like protein